ncbi:GAF domain-containing protein [[Phormidium ambiguum] IAM M-71]|uniref:GAF domain-containing protein n=1 Tax=[Phormidium ambiguum] IAM M-71 TaxID=454136 RepID=UPI000AE24688|nr:adenylate/guanylate cyclase domain-containing protein [Phormidium ambiguum]
MSYSNYNLPFIESTTDVIDVKPYMKKQGVNLMLEIPNEVNGQLQKNTQQFKIKMSEPIYTIDFAPYKEKKQHLSGKEESNNIDSNDPQMGKNLTEALPKPNVFQTIETFIDENNISDNEPPKNQNGYRTNGDELNNYQSIETVEYKNGHQNFDLDNDFINSCWDEPQNGYPAEESPLNPENHIVEIVSGSNGVEIKNELHIQENQIIDITAKEVNDEIDEIIDTTSNASDYEIVDVTNYEIIAENNNPIDIEDDEKNSYQNNRSPGGALATTKGSFSSFLAPLNKESFKEAVKEVHQKLSTVNDTLTMVIHSEGMETVLQEMLQSIALKTGELLAADRTTIFLLDEEKNELWSILAKNDGVGTLEIRIPADKGIAGEVATFKRVVNIPFDFFDDPRSGESQKTYKKTGYRTYTMLALPLLSEEGDLVAVVQLLNKLKSQNDATKPLQDRIDLAGFTKEDEVVFEEFAPSIRLILESSRSFYVATQKQRAADALMKANQALSQSSLDLEETLKRVMDEAKKLMNADRSTLWLIDHEREQLWTKIPIGGELKELRIPRNAGFAGMVAESGEPLMIPFDLYDDPRSAVSQQTDQKTGYRTCSMLCMPVFNADNELIGVTQLINKKKQGELPEYNPANWPEAPECWKASFNRTDQEFMQIFNIQAGVALQNAKLFDEVKQQQQMQRDILRSLSNGVLSTDKAGYVIAANESAKKLLGLEENEKVEGKPAWDLVKIGGKEGLQQEEGNKFRSWFQAALEAVEERKRQQYYPDQVLQSIKEEKHSVNLSINTILDVNDASKVRGALVVMEDISHEKRLKSTMYRYMTQEVAEQLLARGDDFKMGGDRKEVSVLFSDIRSYTTLTESMQAEEVVHMLNEYFELMVEAVFQHKGTLDKYIGDAIMAVFGAFVPLEDHALMATKTALEMRHRLAKFNEDRRNNNLQEIKIGIGINSDVVISGNIGSSQRMELTSIGDGVNLGSRLESASKQYGCDIIISQYTFGKCNDEIYCRELDYIRVKGKTQPVSIYELVCMTDNINSVPDWKKQQIDIYHKGREFYLQKEFRLAQNEFSKIVEEMNTRKMKDKASEMYLERCQYWLTHSEELENKWDDGVWSLTEK